MFQGSANVGPASTSEPFVNGGIDERHHQQGPDALLRDAAGQPARAGALARGRSDAVARPSRRTTSTTSATPSRKSAGSGSTISRTVGREVREELAFDDVANEHSVIGSMADLNAATVEDVTAFSRHTTRPTTPSSPRRRCEHEAGTRESLARTSSQNASQPAPPAVDVTQPPQTAERRTTIEDGGPAAGRRHRPTASRRAARRTTMHSQVFADGARQRTERELIREHRAPAAAGGRVGPAPSRPTAAGHDFQDIEATPTLGTSLDALEQTIYLGDRWRVKAGPIAGYRNREGAQLGPGANSWEDVATSLSLAAGQSGGVQFSSAIPRENQFAVGSARQRSARRTSQRVAKQYFTTRESDRHDLDAQAARRGRRAEVHLMKAGDTRDPGRPWCDGRRGNRRTRAGAACRWAIPGWSGNGLHRSPLEPDPRRAGHGVSDPGPGPAKARFLCPTRF